MQGVCAFHEIRIKVCQARKPYQKNHTRVFSTGTMTPSWLPWKKYDWGAQFSGAVVHTLLIWAIFRSWLEVQTRYAIFCWFYQGGQVSSDFDILSCHSNHKYSEPQNHPTNYCCLRSNVNVFIRMLLCPTQQALELNWDNLTAWSPFTSVLISMMPEFIMWMLSVFY
jgi:hypothetical protein